jgi:multiple sugar transport system substrate-binding protein
MNNSVWRRSLAVALVMGLLLALAPASLAQEEIVLTFTCRCVTGGVNANYTSWMKDYVIPTFEEKMAAEGMNVRVDFVEFGGSDEADKERYALDLGVGGGYDVFQFDGSWLAEFVEPGLLKPLNQIWPEVDEWDGWDHMTPGVQSIMTYQGERYGVARGTDVRQIFYRTDLFEQAGIEMPWQPTSWEELLETARQIKEALPDVTPLQINAGTPMGEATTMQGWFMVLLGAGEHMYDHDQGKWIVSSPAILDALNFYKTVYIDEELGDARMQLLEDGRQRSFAGFRDGQIAMLVEGDWFWRSVLVPGSEWGLDNRNEIVTWAKMPAREPGAGYRGQDFVTISGGGGCVINPNTEHPAEAWALVMHMHSRDSMRAMQLLEPRISSRDDVPVAGDPVMTAMAQAGLPYTTVRMVRPEYPQISYEAQLMTERVVSGEMSPEEAMAAYAEAVTAIAGEDNVIAVE